MKHKFLLSLLCLMGMVASVNAAVVASGNCGYSGSGNQSTISDNVTWTLTDDGTLSINGTGQISTYRVHWSDFLNDIKKVVVGEGITGISSYNYPYYLFQNCQNLTAVEWNAIYCTYSQSSGVFSNSTSSYAAKSITSFTFGANVQTVPNCLCFALPKISSIVLPSTVTSIGLSAFYNCTSLGSINLPSTITTIGNSAFSGCSSLTSIKLPSNVTTIGNNAFSGCTMLGTLTIPASVTSIGTNAFSNCSFNKVTFEGVTPPTIDAISFDLALVPASALDTYKAAFPDKANHIVANSPTVNNQTITVTAKSDKSAIHMAIGDANLEQVVSLKVNGTINSYDIMIIRNKMINLQELDLSDADIVGNSYEYYTGICSQDSVLGEQAFTGTSIQKAKLPRSLKQISRYTFNADKLRYLEINSGTLVKQAFYDYYALDTVIVNNAILGENSFYQNNNYSSKYTQMHYLKLNNVTTIPANCFCRCNKLNSVILSNNLARIEESAFLRCSALQNITLPSSLTYIGGNAFQGTGLTSITIPASVSYIGKYAFAGSSSSSYTIYEAGLSYKEKCVVKKEGNYIVFDNGNRYYGYYVDLLPNHYYYIYDNYDVYNVKYENGKYYYHYDNETWYSISTSKQKNMFYVTQENDKLVTIFNITDFSGDDYCSRGGSLRSIVFAPNSALTRFEKSVFDGNDSLKSITFPEHLNWISHEALAGCAIDSLVIPSTVTFIDNLAFIGSTSRYIVLPQSIKEINSYTVAYCPNLKEMVIPTNVETVADYAFYECANLDMLKVASSIRNVGNYAFANCPNVKKVYTYTVEPTQIDQNTFSCWQNANLYVPYTSYYTYFYNTQWSQFLRLVEFDEPYDYFYVNNDYELGGNGTIGGNPDVDLNAGSGLIVDGGETQYLGDVTQHIGDNTAASIVACQNALVCNNLNVRIAMNQGVWYFLCFPFNLPLSSVTWPGQYAIYEYDGAARAANGSGGWIRCNASTLEAGKGYIIQSSVAGDVTINVANPVFSCETFTQPLPVHNAAAAYDANWALIGNPFPAYYNMDDLFAAGFNAPVYVYNKSRNDYDVYMPHDDEYHFHPYEAFFVQNPGSVASVINWTGDGRETLIQSQIQNGNAIVARRSAQTPKHRQFIELNLKETEGENADHTRIVFNPSAQMDYELGTDAVKMAGEAPVRLYTIQDDVQYAINERPYDNGYTALGFHASVDGYYTLSASRLDTTVVLYDNVLQQQVDLQNGDYTFYAEAGTDNTRFGIRAVPQTATSIEDVSGLFDGKVNVYTVLGVQLYQDVEASQIQLPAGVYVFQSAETTRTIILK